MNKRLARRVLPMDWVAIRATRRRNRKLHTYIMYAFWLMMFSMIGALIWHVAEITHP